MMALKQFAHGHLDSPGSRAGHCAQALDLGDNVRMNA